MARVNFLKGKSDLVTLILEFFKSPSTVFKVFFFFNVLLIFERERETECKHGRAEREGDTECEAGSRL